MLASKLIDGTIKEIETTESIQINHGKHMMGYIGVSPIAQSGRGFTVATELEYNKDENFTEYDGFIVENDTQDSNAKAFQKIEKLIELGKLLIKNN